MFEEAAWTRAPRIVDQSCRDQRFAESKDNTDPIGFGHCGLGFRCGGHHRIDLERQRERHRLRNFAFGIVALLKFDRTRQLVVTWRQALLQQDVPNRLEAAVIYWKALAERLELERG